MPPDLTTAGVRASRTGLLGLRALADALCYQAKGAKMDTVAPVYTADQLGARTLAVGRVDELCVPTTKQLP
jgi:hypothetical protein